MLDWILKQSFLKRLITGNEKRVLYSNVNRKRSWSKPGESAQVACKRHNHQKCYVISLMGLQGTIYYETLPVNQTINSGVYIQQLIKVNNAIKKNRSELTNRKQIVFQHDNARSHTSLITRKKILEFGWDCYHIHHIVQTWHHPITIYLDFCKTPWMVRSSITMPISNCTWTTSLQAEIRNFMNVVLWCYLKNGRR